MEKDDDNTGAGGDTDCLRVSVIIESNRVSVLKQRSTSDFSWS